ncbi:MAG: P1 family peptidase [Acetobacteraceae bacterium]|nr:P1 family peptidase [Acetobacteraceae bacterium]
MFRPGTWNAITDVAGVRVGQVTVIEGEAVRTGATAILPHGGNPYQDRVPAGLSVMNGYGKLAGATQLVELGEIETPIVLTNTLAVGRAVEAVVDWTLALPGNEAVRSVNAVVGETNDGRLNDIRRRGVTAAHVLQAITEAAEGPVAEGSVGAGTGTMAFGWKGGIGTSSRLLPPALGGYRVGVLAQTNFGGALLADGVPLGRALGKFYLRDHADRGDADGSVMLVVATDAPLSDRNLTRLAHRAMAGLARTGAAFSDGSGDYAIAFSTHPEVRRTPARRQAAAPILDLPNDLISPLFVAVAEATEEAILNSLFMARSVESRDPLTGKRVTGRAIDLGAVRQVLVQKGRR